MRQGRATHEPLIFLAFFLTAAVIAEASGEDFQVIYLRGALNRPEQRLTLIRSEKELSAAWTEKSAKPNIDFDHWMLVVVDLGPRPSSGYDILIQSVTTRAARDSHGISSTYVNVLDLRPGIGPVLAQLTHPAAYALIPQTTNDIKLTTSRADSDCTSPPPGPPFVK